MLSNRIKELREEKGYSYRDLASLSGVSKSSILMYEQGKRNPKREVLEAFADIFNVDMDYLLGRSDTRSIHANEVDDIVRKRNQSSLFDGMSKNRRKLIEFAMTVTDEQAERLLQVMKIIVEGDK